jgi:putative phosphoribosyl transferase
MTFESPFLNRREAGLALAACLRGEDLGDNPVVLALPRGGVPVGAEVAEALDLAVEVFLVRKLGFPHDPETAMGAIASGGVQLLDDDLIAQVGVTPQQLAAVIEREQIELRRHEQIYRPRRMLSLGWRAAVIVDDGLATGFTMRAAVAALRRTNCPKITVAVPVGAKAACEEIARDVDLLICPLQPRNFSSVGQWYEDFTPTSDREILACLERVALHAHTHTHEAWRG